MPILVPEQEKRLLKAADALRKIVEPRPPFGYRECLVFQSLLQINNLYLLNLYSHLEERSVSHSEKGAKLALHHASYDYILNERKSAPMAFETPNSAFCRNLCEMLNLPFFEEEMETPQTHPAMQFTQTLWSIYSENKISSRNVTRQISVIDYEPTG
jgi:hypothetical protein